MRKTARDRILEAIYGGPKGRMSPQLRKASGVSEIGVGMNRGLFTPEYTPVDIMELALSFLFFRGNGSVACVDESGISPRDLIGFAVRVNGY